MRRTVRADARHVALARVFQQEPDALAVRRIARAAHVAIERGGEHAWRAPGRRHDREMRRRVPQQVGFGVHHVRDLLAVGTPGRLLVGTRIGGHLAQAAAARGVVRRDDPDVVVAVGVGLGRAVGDEGDPLAVGAPGRIAFVVVPCGDLAHGAARQREHVEVCAQRVEVTGAVLLELQPRDDLGSRTLAGPRRTQRVADREHESSAVGRPLVGVHSLGHARERPGFAATTVECPHLRLGLAARVGGGTRAPRPRRQERQIPAVGAPARVTRRIARGGERKGRAARVERRHPQARLVLVGLEIDRAHGVRHPAPVGTDLRRPDLLDGEEVVDRDRTFRRVLCNGGRRAECQQH